MFGTLVTGDFDAGTLEFVENPDHASAVSRNLQDKRHISCLFCRSRKVRCSGGRQSCQRCVAMGLECVYPQSQSRAKKQEQMKSPKITKGRSANMLTRIASSDAELTDVESQRKYSDVLPLDGVKSMGFDDGYIDESLFNSWIMDTPMQNHAEADFSPSSSASSSNDFNFARSMSPLSTGRRSIASQSSRPSAGSNLIAELSRQPSSQNMKIPEPWKMSGQTQRSTSVSMSLDDELPSSTETTPSWGESRSNSEACSCLVGSISFLEKVVSKSASSESRIDVLLAEVRQSMETMVRFIECERCETRVEQTMLLAMATRQISILCKKLADCYREVKLSRETETRGATGSNDISILGYRASQREKLYLVKGLVTLQLADFQKVIAAVKSRYRQRPDQAQVDALTEATTQLELAHAIVNTM